MKISEVISELAEMITANGDVELGDDFLIHQEYGTLKIK